MVTTTMHDVPAAGVASAARVRLYRVTAMLAALGGVVSLLLLVLASAG